MLTVVHAGLRSFPGEPSSVPAARRWARRALSDQTESIATAQDVELMVSELVTNAVKHGSRGRVTVALSAMDGTIRVEVHDPGHGTPIRRYPRPESLGGRGLMLVEQLAVDWGVRLDPEGTTVWFEVGQ
ncbi:MAG: ATP-binding protein [Nonomuraea sp.]|nr:ATP-binding protein [Nonomuraea sp.]